ncbi:hypothetical protein NG43_01820 [Winslowiella iniecta]|uniref:Uncharacterized protein n=1 Tax=Winslowiella iniecta TaxID=1560201 RepID=A0A0L7THZ7_9GAMM|nr:hypothetical protein NG43_01820 [Winslowiella iniecta]
MRRIRHIRAMVSDRKQFNTVSFGVDNIVVQGAVGVGTGNGVHMKINGVHSDFLLFYKARIASLPFKGLIPACDIRSPFWQSDHSIAMSPLKIILQ